MQWIQSKEKHFIVLRIARGDHTHHNGYCRFVISSIVNSPLIIPVYILGARTYYLISVLLPETSMLAKEVSTEDSF